MATKVLGNTSEQQKHKQQELLTIKEEEEIADTRAMRGGAAESPWLCRLVEQVHDPSSSYLLPRLRVSALIEVRYIQNMRGETGDEVRYTDLMYSPICRVALT